ncbi:MULTISPECIES: DegT/DnrJ/EryC1/StrS family aminotransferase [Methanobacterium]|uniref:DegT/DnrJ/EryC1/StrS family aminotransferase n=1 Tax=Methanobacterium veterum TaxID=408577 RepID=A0A9E5DJT8_9EURY|nr:MULTISPECIES: DegT/DnrJ/EryC1/StrS family aminotransferase [Methanobacterium]MCZ3364919.1 DegT/DnrJ/EryC1/StrS family aminotransferase [Methanobacterium veterum]MCZ3372674.1 DegT/DnrJ/EryC1/StrS family aminotransferase [Methanobacterium veterum]
MINVTMTDVPELEDYIEYLRVIWNERILTNDGELLRLLETKLKAYLKVKNLMAVTNGTLALQIALKSLPIKGEVITTPFTFSATTNSILWEGLTPVFADIDENTFNIDPTSIETKITDKTSCILAVHVYGNPCQVKELQEIADDHSLKLIYDAAHAFGVEYNNKSVLEYGDVSTLSFHATKVFNTIEGGALTTSDKNLVEKIKLMRNHGIISEEEVIIPGTNAKMNEFQAAMGLCNLKNIDQNIEKRKKIYEIYRDNLEGNDLKFQKIVASKYNYSYMPVCFKNLKVRNEIYNQLLKEGIHCRKYFYPLTVNFEYFNNNNLVEKYDLKKASNIADRILCLPIYPDLEEEIVNEIITKISSLI